ncbi:hypothetical protein NEUTE2DRAFT_67255 [Neurospora tetrasperma FGSC 2509]|nr:hypothetical protein NEUTE2DRAFT_67255 [Neurospora tetrasperma FGSC 2509]
MEWKRLRKLISLHPRLHMLPAFHSRQFSDPFGHTVSKRVSFTVLLAVLNTRPFYEG